MMGESLDSGGGRGLRQSTTLGSNQFSSLDLTIEYKKYIKENHIIEPVSATVKSNGGVEELKKKMLAVNEKRGQYNLNNIMPESAAACSEYRMLNDLHL